MPSPAAPGGSTPPHPAWPTTSSGRAGPRSRQRRQQHVQALARLDGRQAQQVAVVGQPRAGGAALAGVRPERQRPLTPSPTTTSGRRRPTHAAQRRRRPPRVGTTTASAVRAARSTIARCHRTPARGQGLRMRPGHGVVDGHHQGRGGAAGRAAWARARGPPRRAPDRSRVPTPRSAPDAPAAAGGDPDVPGTRAAAVSACHAVQVETAAAAAPGRRARRPPRRRTGRCRPAPGRGTARRGQPVAPRRPARTDRSGRSAAQRPAAEQRVRPGGRRPDRVDAHRVVARRERHACDVSVEAAGVGVDRGEVGAGDPGRRRRPGTCRRRRRGPGAPWWACSCPAPSPPGRTDPSRPCRRGPASRGPRVGRVTVGSRAASSRHPNRRR